MSTKTKTNSTTLAIVEALTDDPEFKRLPYNSLLAMADSFRDEVYSFALTERIYRNSAPETPGDNPPPPPDETYRREKLKPTPEPVPDAAGTEGTTSIKISVPDYGNAKRFSQAMGELAKTASELFETESNDNQQKDDLRRQAFDWHDELRSAIYDL